MVKRIFALLITLLLIGSMAVTAFANHPVPDLTQNGSITFVMDWDGQLLDSGNLNLYKVGEIVENDGDYSFALIDKLDGSDLTLEEINDPILAQELLTISHVMKLQKLSAPIDDGGCVFEDLEPALYLVWQGEGDASDGFVEISPFVISVPKFDNDRYILDVIADPKVPLETVPPTTAPPPPEEMPQTGQLNWPVPVLAIGGAAMLILGFVLRTSGKKERRDA